MKNPTAPIMRITPYRVMAEESQTAQQFARFPGACQPAF